jgi:tRNA threonylcarbamoyladenosine modification (KEOPS) complex Cgi121 subunit
MPTILQVYRDYKITRTLQLHQLRVAAVAQQICDNLTIKVDSEVVIMACLIHDMGNILKFVFTAPEEWFEPEGKKYWRQIQKEMAEKYKTTNEHKLSLMIAKELKVSNKVLTCIESIDFSKTIQTVSGPTVEPKICDYADLRVNPYGVFRLIKGSPKAVSAIKNDLTTG